ncbi:cell division protein FtsQ/DivIB [Devosia sp.]|uniref:cell division protein FtsQ/DivIB n=1 Tax=Devosia sp. TaxID=1871048 RepID=UPI003A91C925
MQQVGEKQFFANAQLVHPRNLPAPLARRSRNALVAANHVWVLHRQLIIRILLVVAALATLVGLYQTRDVLASAGATAIKMVQGEFAQAGFGVTGIEITGQRLTNDADIISLLTVGAGDSTLTFDAQQAQARLTWLAAVKSATVRKIYPNRIVVEIVEKTPLLRWRIGDTTWLVDEKGTRIGTDIAAFTELPLVIGEGANDDAVAMVRILERHPMLQEGLAALSRIGDRRWDLLYRNGLRVQLPEHGVAQALDRLEMYQGDYALLDRDVTEIDLRVDGLVTLKPGETAAEAIEAARKAKSKSRS